MMSDTLVPIGPVNARASVLNIDDLQRTQRFRLIRNDTPHDLQLFTSADGNTLVVQIAPALPLPTHGKVKTLKKKAQARGKVRRP